MAKRRQIHSTLLLVGPGYQNWYRLPHAIKVPARAHTVCAQRQVVSVQQGQSLLQMHGLSRMQFFGASLSKGHFPHHLSKSQRKGAHMTEHLCKGKGRATLGNERAWGFHIEMQFWWAAKTVQVMEGDVSQSQSGQLVPHGRWCPGVWVFPARASCLAPLATHQCHVCSSS